MSDLNSVLQAINESLEATAGSLAQLRKLYADGEREKNGSGADSTSASGVAQYVRASNEKVSLLSLKNGAMLSYLSGLLLVVQGKMDREAEDPTGARGRAIAIENRVVLERGVKPLEKKLAYQLDKLIRAYKRMEKEYQDAEERAREKSSTIAASSEQASEDDSSDSEDEDEEMEYRPNVVKSKGKTGAQQGEEEEEEANEDGNSDGVYRPPKISAMLPPTQQSQHFEDKFNVKDHKDRSGKSRMQAMDEYLRDQSDQPDWEASIGANIVNHGRGGIKSSRQTDKERRITSYEEDNFTRLNNMGINKNDRRKQKQRERMNRVNVIGGEDFGIFNNSKRTMEESTSRRGAKKSRNAWDRAKRRL